MGRRGNCLWFALAAWLRWPESYFAVRRTRHLVGWHWLIHHRGRWIAWEPLHYHDSVWREMLAKLWYSGRVARDDKPRSTTMNDATVTISFNIATKAHPNAHSTTLVYNGMDAAQIAQFELDLLEAFAAMQAKWMKQAK